MNIFKKLWESVRRAATKPATSFGPEGLTPPRPPSNNPRVGGPG